MLPALKFSLDGFSFAATRFFAVICQTMNGPVVSCPQK
jgi:hypothetical protein